MKNIDRRDALKAGLAIAATAAVTLAGPEEARADTASDAEAAKAELERAQERLEELGDRAEEAANRLSAATDAVEEGERLVKESEERLAELEAELEGRREVLAERVSASYKAGKTNLLGVVLGAESYDQMAAGVSYLDRIAQNDADAIEDVEKAQAEVEAEKKAREEELERLEESKERAKAESEALKAEQEKASAEIQSLSKKAKQLAQKADSELLGAAVDGTLGTPTPVVDGPAGPKGEAIVAACRRVGSPGAGLCAMWVSKVYQAAGFGYPGGNACDQYRAYCKSSDRSELKPGMMVAVPTHPRTRAGRIYGHVGIYIGNGMVMDNIGRINTQSLDSWIAFYESAGVKARWGFA